jgi:hypothetical protein
MIQLTPQANLTGFSCRRIQFNLGIAAWLFDHSCRPYQHIRRNRQADLLRRFEFGDELELDRLLDGKIRRRPAFQDLVDKRGGASPLILNSEWMTAYLCKLGDQTLRRGSEQW